MSKEAEKLRRVEGGAGTLNTKIVKEVNAESAVGKLGLGIYAPAGSIIVGAFIKNKENDLAGAGASIALVCGNADLIDATEVAAVKASGVGGCFEGHYIEADTEIEIEVTDAAVTGGTLEVGILYM